MNVMRVKAAQSRYCFFPSEGRILAPAMPESNRWHSQPLAAAVCPMEAVVDMWGALALTLTQFEPCCRFADQ